MKMKITILFSLINILFLVGFYIGLIQPILDENKVIMNRQIELTATLIKNNKFLEILKQSLNNFSTPKTPKTNQLTKIMIKLAKKQGLTIKQIDSIFADTAANPAIGLSIQTNGSYQNSLKFIFYVNQLPFLLHWSNITLVRANKDAELTANIMKNE